MTLSAVALTSRGGRAQPLVPTTEYAAKVLCGVLQFPGGGGLVSVNLNTAINIHNPNPIDVDIQKQAVLAPPERDATASRQPGPFQPFTIAPDGAFEIDCPDILALLGATGPVEGAGAAAGSCTDGLDNDGDSLIDLRDPDCFTKGFAVIQSATALDVVGVYGAQRVLDGVTPGVGHGLEVDTIAPRPIPPPDPSTSTYAAKFVCGLAGASDALVSGDYFTAINIHNPNAGAAGVGLRKKFVLALSENEPTLPPTPFFTESLPSDGAFEIDCADIAQHLTAAGILFGPFFTGWVVLQSNTELDVVGVYLTTNAMAIGAGGGVGLKLDIEPVWKSQAPVAAGE